MSKMEIVTGSTGLAHVTPIDDAVRNTNTGHYDDNIVFTVDGYSNFAARIKTANDVEVSGGYGMMHGRIFKIAKNDKVDCIIESENANLKRMDIISARYTFTDGTATESIDLAVIKGASGSDYAEPTGVYSTGDINDGAKTYDFPLYKVYINGTLIDHLEALFTPLPDGGRLGEIEAAFEQIQANFDALSAEMSSIPSEVAQAASKSYVDNAVGTLGNGKAALFHNYKKSAHPAVSGSDSMGGTSSQYGHVLVRDDYDTSDTDIAAANACAASLKAVHDLAAAFTDGCNGIATALTRKGVTPTKGENTVNYTPDDFIRAIGKYKRKVHYKITISRTANHNLASGFVLYDGTVTVVIGGVTKTFTFQDTHLAGLGIGIPKKSDFSDKTWTQNV